MSTVLGQELRNEDDLSVCNTQRVYVGGKNNDCLLCTCFRVKSVPGTDRRPWTIEMFGLLMARKDSSEARSST